MPRPEALVATDDVRAALRGVIDPELGLDVVALGLLREVQVEPDGAGAAAGAAVRVTMTLTTPGCPLHETITDDARRRLAALPGVAAVVVELVWDPPWTPARMSDEARRALGWT